jgi:hypothetical protein
VSTSLPHEIDKLSLSTPNAASSLPRTSTTTEAVLIHSARVSSLDYVPSNSPFEVAPLVQSPSIPSALMPSAMPSASVLSPSIPAPRHKFSFNFWDEDSETEPAGFHLSAPAHQSESTVPSSSVAQPLPQTPASSFKSLSADNQDMDLEDRDFYRSAPLHPSELASHLQHKTSSGQTSGTWKPTWTPKNCFALHLPDTRSSPLRRISTSKREKFFGLPLRSCPHPPLPVPGPHPLLFPPPCFLSLTEYSAMADTDTIDVPSSAEPAFALRGPPREASKRKREWDCNGDSEDKEMIGIQTRGVAGWKGMRAIKRRRLA